jgi:hypothetical protein
VSDGGCSRRVALLIDLEAGLPVDGDIDAARAHLGSCPTCRHQVEATALTVLGLERLADEVRSAEPSPEAWDHLQRRILRETSDRTRVGHLAISHRLLGRGGPAAALPIVPLATACGAPCDPHARPLGSRWAHQRRRPGLVPGGDRSAGSAPVTE